MNTVPGSFCPSVQDDGPNNDHSFETFATYVDPRGSSLPTADSVSVASYTSVTTTSDMQEAHPRYTAPHRRQVRLEMGDNTVIPNINPAKPDEQGVANRCFQKLLVYVHFALTANLVKALSRRFPGMFFQTDDHGNHDHPIAHVVTQVGTRMLQRMCPAGARILDVFGNPAAAEAFNRSQRKARLPKVMSTLVNAMCPSDFIRAVNKWGMDYASAVGSHFQGAIRDMVSDDLKEYNVFSSIHTLYYMQHEDIFHLIRSSPGSKVLALIHRHDKEHGFLNDGEQEYWVKRGIVKQRNVASNTCYYHPDVSKFWFGETKHHIVRNGQGFAWEVNFVCEDTWIVEIVGYDIHAQRSFDCDEWMGIFEGYDADYFDPLAPATVEPVESRPEPVTFINSGDGSASVSLTVCSDKLFTALRRQAVGKSRSGASGRKLFESLMASAKHLTAPGALFPDAEVIECPAHLLVDHVLSAMVTDLARETDLFSAMQSMHSSLHGHSLVVMGARPLCFTSFSSFLGAARATLRIASGVAGVAASSNVVGSTLSKVDSVLEENYG